MRSILLTAVLAANFFEQITAAYTLIDNFNATNFFDHFEFFSDPDPTNGFVNYQNAATANSKSVLAGYTSSADHPNTVYMGVDFATADPVSPGRDSVRVHSKKIYNKGLFIADIKHMPGSICGAWPAFWTVGIEGGKDRPWPFDGEIDILEGVNDQVTNKVTLHTSAGCVMKSVGALNSSKLNDGNCNKEKGYEGCGYDTADPLSYGSEFNRVGGGVYALEWTSKVIRVFFFPRHLIPADVRGESPSPNPDQWGLPVAAFAGGEGCDIDQHFKDHRIVFDTTFCGQWAGEVWETIGECRSVGKTCMEYVKGNPEVYKEAFWELNGLRVYQTNA